MSKNVETEDNEGYEIYDHPAWDLFKSGGVVYYAGYFLYGSVEMFNISNVLIALTDVEVNL